MKKYIIPEIIIDEFNLNCMLQVSTFEDNDNTGEWNKEGWR